MHRSRMNGVLIDCKTDDIGAAAEFWAQALGRTIDHDHAGSRGNYMRRRQVKLPCRFNL